MEVKLDITEAHLWLEELLAGDDSIEPDKVWQRFTRSGVLLGKLAGNSELVVHSDLQEGSLFSARVGHLEETMSQLAVSARHRVNRYEGAQAGSASDKAFDQTFLEFQSQIDELLAHAQMVGEQQADAHINYFFWACLLLFCIWAPYLWFLYSHERSRHLLIQQVQDSEAGILTLINSLPDLVWMKDVKGVYLRCNAEFERFFGAKESEIVGKTDYDFVDRDLADFFRSNDRAAMAAGGPSVNEEEVTYAEDGHFAILETTKTPVYGKGGKILGVLGIGHDITGRKQALDQLESSERRLMEAQRLAKLGSWELDLVTGELHWSDEVYRIFGFDKEKVGHVRDFFINSIPPDEFEYVNKVYQDSLENKTEYEVQHRVKTPSGAYKYVLVRGETSYDGDTPIRTLGTVMDVTEKVESEQRMLLLSKAINQSPVSVIITDLDGIITYVNDGFENISGYRRKDVIGEHARMLGSGLTPIEVYEEMWSALTDGCNYSCEIQNRKKSGEIF